MEKKSNNNYVGQYTQGGKDYSLYGSGLMVPNLKYKVEVNGQKSPKKLIDSENVLDQLRNATNSTAGRGAVGGGLGALLGLILTRGKSKGMRTVSAGLGGLLGAGAGLSGDLANLITKDKSYSSPTEVNLAEEIARIRAGAPTAGHTYSMP